MAVADYYAEVQKIYVAYYGRPADKAGLEFWASKLNAANGNLNDIINAFGTSAEAQALYGNQQPAVMVNKIYNQLFGHDADPTGLLFYVGKLNSGEMTAASIALDVANGAQNADKTALDNKIAAAEKMTSAMDTTAEIVAYSGDAAAAAARTELAKVTDTTDVTAFDGQAAVSTVVAAGSATLNAGKTFTLTTGVDNLVGAADNDTFKGLFGTSATADTLGTADTIDGLGGNDTLELTATGTTASGVAEIKNVETINIKDLVGATFDATLLTGANNINFTNTVAGKTSKVQKLADFNTVVGITGKGNLTVGYADTTGTADTAKVAIDGLGSKSATGTITRSTVDVSNTNTVEGVSVEATNDNYLTLTGGTALKTVTVTGAGNVDITGTALTGNATDQKLTYDASAATGKQTITFGSGVMTIKGGSADDTFNFGTTMGSTDNVDGGAGNDKVTFTIGSAVQTIPTIANVEALDVKWSAAGTLNAGNITGATTLNVQGASAVNATNLDQGISTVNFNDSSTTSGATLGYASGSSSDVAINIGHINTATNGVGSSLNIGALALSGNAGTVTLNAIVDPDNTTAITDQTGTLNVGTATAMTFNSAKLANLTVGAITAGSATNYTVNADGGKVTTGTLATADKLTTLTVNSKNDGAVNIGAIGGTKAASALTDVKIDVASKVGTTAATVTTGQIDAVANATAGASTSALKNVDITLGDNLGAVSIGNIVGKDTNTAATATTTDGAGIAALDHYNLTTGANTAIGTASVLSALSVTNVAINAADSTTATTVKQTLNVDKSLGNVSINTGSNDTLVVTINGISDAETTELYNLDVGTITAAGKGAVTLSGLATGINSIGTIDLSAVEGKSEVAASTLAGTSGINITIGSGGTTTTGVSGSGNADVITGGKGADTIIGGAGADSITGGEGADTITGGTGNDVINLTETTAAVDTLKYSESGSTNVDTVSGFKAGSDVVQFSSGNIAFSSTVNDTLSDLAGSDLASTATIQFTTVDAGTANTVTAATGDNAIFFSNTSASSFATAIASDKVTITDLNFTLNAGHGEAIAAVYYDSNNGEAVYGYILNTDTTTTTNAIDTNDTFVEIVRVGMTSADYTAANVDLAVF